jgi:flagellar basal-body rod modification protein FlgD
MRGDLQSRISPFTQNTGKDFSATKIKDKDTPVAPKADEVDFMNVLNNSNSDVKRERNAKKVNGGIDGKESYEEFLGKISDKEKELRTPKNNLDKDDFLKLFITQLQNQDPLNPEDSTEMASRLAHFNSLEQMLNVNKTLNTMLDTQKQGRSVDMVSYIGKEVSVEGGRIAVDKAGVVAESVFNVARPAVKSVLEIRDSAGAVVHSKELGTLNEGEQRFQWDGTKTDGSKAAGGVYTYSVIAQGINSEEIPVTISTKAKVTGVDLQDKDGKLHTNMGAVRFDEIKAIGNQGFGQVDAPEVKTPKVDEVTPPELKTQKVDGGIPPELAAAGINKEAIEKMISEQNAAAAMGTPKAKAEPKEMQKSPLDPIEMPATVN